MVDLVMRDRAPELVVTDAAILTMDDDLPEAQALAVKDGRIVAVGTSQAVEELAGRGTVVRRLGGRRVVPGLNDTHNHLLSTGTVLNDVQLYDCRSIDEIK